MATYSEIKMGLDRISVDNSHNRDILVNARASLVVAQSNLAAMVSKYSILVADIDSEATANPADDNYQLAKTEKDKMVSDFQALKTWADALIAAHDTVDE